ncbi:MAG: cupredoxin domain-containing protein [Acidimicrobiia bacterium]
MCAVPRSKVRRWRARAGAAVLVAAVASGCGDTSGGDDEAAPEVPEGAAAVITSRDVQFEPSEVTVPAGEEVLVVHVNDDDGMNHNIHLKSAPGSPKTPLERGRGVQELRVTLDPGEYPYTCDLHPNMKGTLVAE